MLKLMIGKKGTGKTKAIIEAANVAVEKSPGSVICVEYGNKLTFDIKHQVRLINCLDYSINDGNKLYGFICGLLAGNYDITDIFIDSALKICHDNIDEFDEFITAVAPLLEENGINCMITSSMTEQQLSEPLKKFLI